MATYLDTSRWPRRDAFEYFRGFDKPYFNVCTRLDVAPLKAALAARGGGSLMLAYYFIALRLANEQEPFRLRLEGGRVSPTVETLRKYAKAVGKRLRVEMV